MKFKIVKYPSGILRKGNAPVPTDKPRPFYTRLAWELQAAMKQKNGVGIAAPQLGKNVQAAYVDAPQYSGLVINPTIISEEGEPVTDIEGCLSVPKMSYPVQRAPMINVRFLTLDSDGLTEVDLIVNGFTARVFQHELDHLNGVCIPDRAGVQERDKVRAILAKSKSPKP